MSVYLSRGVVVQIFFQRFKSLFFSAGTLLGLALGILLGTLMPQPYDIGWLVLLGWLLIPIALISLPFGYNAIANANGPGGFQWPQWAVWARWGVVLYYVLLLVSYGWCSYRATRQKGSVELSAFIAIPLLVMAPLAGLVGFWLGRLFSTQADRQGWSKTNH